MAGKLGDTNMAPPDAPSLQYPDKSRQIIIKHALIPSITLLFVLLRNYSRFFHLRTPGWEDVFLNVGWLITAVLGGLLCLATEYGMGKHILDVTPAEMVGLFKIVWTSQVLYLAANFSLKTTFFLFYLRIEYRGTVYNMNRFFIFLNFCIFLAFLIANSLICRPLSFFWNPSSGKGTCVNLKAIYVTNTVSSMIMDYTTLCFPIYIIWRSPTLVFQRKLSVSFLCLLGVIACTFSVIRIPVLLVLFTPGVNTTAKVREAAIYAVLELNFAIVAACIISIKPLFDSILYKSAPTMEFSPTGTATGTIPDPWQSKPNTKDGKDKDSHGALRRDDIGLEEMSADAGTMEDLHKVPSDGRWESTHSIISSK